MVRLRLGNFVEQSPEKNTLSNLEARLAGRYISVKWDMDELFARKDDIITHDLLKIRMRV